MIEENGFDHGLEEIDQIIVTPDVGQFVSQDRIELIGSEAHENGSGNQDRGAQPADKGRHFHQRRFQQPHGNHYLHSRQEAAKSFQAARILDG